MLFVYGTWGGLRAMDLESRYRWLSMCQQDNIEQQLWAPTWVSILSLWNRPRPLIIHNAHTYTNTHTYTHTHTHTGPDTHTRTHTPSLRSLEPISGEMSFCCHCLCFSHLLLSLSFHLFFPLAFQPHFIFYQWKSFSPSAFVSICYRQNFSNFQSVWESTGWKRRMALGQKTDRRGITEKRSL